MKTNMINTNSVMKKIVNRALAAKKNVVKYICAVVMLLGMSVSVWGAIPSGYELVDDLSDLSTGDYVVLYNATSGYGVSGIGNCVDGEYVSGYEATVSTTEGMWIQYYVTKGASNFTLKDNAADKFVVRSSNSFTYGNSGTAFTVSSSGGLVESTKSLIATTVFSGKSCERASARWGTPGTLYAVYKVGSTKIKEDNDYYTVSPTSSISITIDGEDGYFSDYSDDWLANVTAKVAFGGAIWAEFTGFPSSVSDYLYTVNQSGTVTGFILNKTANAAQVTDKIGLNYYGYSYISNGTYSGYLHVYPANPGSNTDIEYYIPLTITVENSVDCTSHDISLTNSGSATHGSFSTSPADEQCEGETVTITAVPTEGYEPNVWTVLDGSAEDVSLSGSGNTRTFTMPTSDVEVEVTFRARSYTITLNNQSATTAGTPSISVTYGASTNLSGTPAITVPEKTGYTFNGYYTATSGGGVQIIAANGNVVAEVDDGVNIYTGDNKEWLYAGDIVLYAYWTTNSHTLAVENESYITTVTATPSTSSAVNKNSSGTVYYGETVTLSYSGISGGYAFKGWDVHETVSGNAVSVTNDQFTMPDANVTVDALLYDKSKMKTSCPSEVDMTITGSVYLTSYAGVTVYTTDNPNNLITVKCDDFGSANKLGIQYLVNGSPVVKGSSLFRLCYYNYSGQSDYGVADGSNDGTYDYISLATAAIKAQYASSGQTFAISYTPGASEYNQTDTYTLRLIALNGSSNIGHADIELHGRALPQKFVIAAQVNGQWCALPADLVTSSGTAIQDAYPITVNNDLTAAVYAPKQALYSGAARNKATKHRGGIRLNTMTGTNDGHLQAPRSNSLTYLWRTSNNCSTGMQEWYLKSTDLQRYTIGVDPSIYVSSGSGGDNDTEGNTGTLINRYLCVYDNKIMWSNTEANEFRILPVTNELVRREASVTEWGQNSVILDVDAQTASSAQARLGAGSPETAASFGQTRTSVKDAASKYNYTLSFNTLDFSLHKGELLYIDWLDGSSNVLSIIASTNDMTSIDGTKGHWETEVHVLPGVTLTANGGSFGSSTVVVKELNIYPGATVNVTTGTLNATTLILRNGWSRAGSTRYDVARLLVTTSAGTLKATNVYADWYIDYDQYYPVAVPWNVNVSGISYQNTTASPTVGPSGQIRLRYYDGASRADNGQTGVGSGANWKEYGAGDNTAVPATLVPGIGYAMTAKRPTGKAFSVVRMPLTLPSGAWAEGSWTTGGEKGEVSEVHKDQVSVTAHGADANPAKPTYLVGWNFIANPYMAIYEGALTHSVAGEEIEYVTIPDIYFKDYGQYPAETKNLLPASGFFIQTSKTGTLTFDTSNRKASAPGLRKDGQTPTFTKQKAYITLSDDNAEDMMGLIVSEKYTADYEINADLEKSLGEGNSLKTYMQYEGMNMAYLAINKTLAMNWIPVVVRIPATGEYTFTMDNASVVDELEGVYLIDYSNNQVTNLINNDYTFSAEAGTITGRFAINGIVGEKTATSVDEVGSDSEGPQKFIYHDKMYILNNGVIYDAVGKKVREIK